MAKITRAIPVKHGNGHMLGGLLHYVQAASNHAAKAYRKGARGKELYRGAPHKGLPVAVRRLYRAGRVRQPQVLAHAQAQ